MFSNNLVEYIIQMSNQRFLARVRHKNVVLTQKIYSPYIYTKSIDDIKELIIDDIRSKFGLSSINRMNTKISKVLKYGSTKGECIYVLKVLEGCFVSEIANRITQDHIYLLGRDSLKRLLVINKAMITFPKLLPVEQETAIETLQYNRTQYE